MKLAAIVCDLDGVLVDSTRSHDLGYADLWQRVGVAGPAYERIAGRATGDVVREVTRPLEPSPALVREWVEYKQERARAHLAGSPLAFPDVLPALRALAPRFRLAVATGASRRTAALLLERAELTPFFPVVVSADDVQRSKPDPEPFARAIELSGIRPDEALVIEDSGAGLASALAAGAWAVSVRSGVTQTGSRFLGAFEDLLGVAAHIGGPAA